MAGVPVVAEPDLENAQMHSGKTRAVLCSAVVRIRSKVHKQHLEIRCAGSEAPDTSAAAALVQRLIVACCERSVEKKTIAQ